MGSSSSKRDGDELARGFEPLTTCLQNRCSAVELRQPSGRRGAVPAAIQPPPGEGREGYFPGAQRASNKGAILDASVIPRRSAPSRFQSRSRPQLRRADFRRAGPGRLGSGPGPPGLAGAGRRGSLASAGATSCQEQRGMAPREPRFPPDRRPEAPPLSPALSDRGERTRAPSSRAHRVLPSPPPP